MTTNLPYELWGRPVKPVAAAIAASMSVLALTNALSVGVVEGFASHVILAAAAAAGTALAGGWIGNSQRMVEWGLLLATGVWVVRTVFVGLTEGWGFYGLYLNMCWVAVAGSTYLLEAIDDGTGVRRRLTS